MKKIFLHATYDCNAFCKHCAVPREKSHMDFEVFKQMIDSIPMEFLVIGGGEPLIHQNINEMLEYASKVTNVKIETNGELLTKYFLEKNKYNLFQMNVSIDGVEETHNKIRGIKTFNHTTEMIKYARSLDIDVAIWSVIMKENVDEVDDIIKLTRNLSVDKLSFLYATPVGKCSLEMTLPFNEYQNIVKKVKQKETSNLQIRIAPYILPFDSKLDETDCLINVDEILHVDPYGEIYPCVLLLGNEKYKLGSVQEGYKNIRVNSSDCLGLIESLGKDTRSNYGIPVCPCRTISSEWNFDE